MKKPYRFGLLYLILVGIILGIIIPLAIGSMPCFEKPKPIRSTYESDSVIKK